MKRVLTMAVAAGLMTAATAFGGSIVQSKHNLSSTGTGTLKGNTANTSQICVYCHAPHGAASTQVLWNRNNPTATLYKLYSGVNMQSRQFSTGFSADSTSLFCMSCHDGTNTVLGGTQVHNQGANIRVGVSGNTGKPLMAGSIFGANGDLGTDLRTTHPVNFPVPTTNNSQNDLWLSPIAGGNYMGGNINVPFDFPLYKATGRDGGSARALECGSCHAVHDSTNSPFLRYTLDGSKLCLGCHNK
jgi:predicted CXXCH cytochrome family protein